MDVNKLILSLKCKPKQPVSGPTQDIAVVLKGNRAQTKSEPNPAQPKKYRMARSIPVSDAYAQLTPFWLALFDSENVRLMEINVLQDLIQDKGFFSISVGKSANFALSIF